MLSLGSLHGILSVHRLIYVSRSGVRVPCGATYLGVLLSSPLVHWVLRREEFDVAITFEERVMDQLVIGTRCGTVLP